MILSGFFKATYLILTEISKKCMSFKKKFYTVLGNFLEPNLMFGILELYVHVIAYVLSLYVRIIS